MKKILSFVLVTALILTGCSPSHQNSSIENSVVESDSRSDSSDNPMSPIVAEENPLDEDNSSIPLEDIIIEDNLTSDVDRPFYGLNDPALLQYLQDSISANLTGEFASEDYIIENVSAIYYSKEYLEELAYNSQPNIFFGFTLEELDKQFQGSKYIFTLGDSGETVVEPFKEYDDTYERVIRNVIIGTGVILVCVTVSVATGGAGLAPVSMIFAASAKTGATMALSSGLFSGVAAGVVKGIQTESFDEAIKAAALAGSEAFKWGAITGAIAGGISEANSLRSAKAAAEAAGNATTAAKGIPSWRESEEAALKLYGGQEQVSYLGGVEVPKATPGATRPDIVRKIGDTFEAIEVKNYDLEGAANRSELYSELVREITARVNNLPDGYTQRIVLDVTGRGFSSNLLTEVINTITERLFDIYPNIPIDIMGAVL